MAEDERKPMEDEPRRWQVKYKDGGGEQVAGESEEAVRASRTEFWGDREIVSVEELIPEQP